MTDHSTDAKTDRAAERRRLLVATAAAPIVATLPKGAAWASSLIQCLQDSSDQTDGALLDKTTTDQWVRTRALTALFYTSKSNPPLGSQITLWSLDEGTTWLNREGDKVPEANSDPANCVATEGYCLRPPILQDPNDPEAPLGTKRVYALASYVPTNDLETPVDPAKATSAKLRGFFPEEKPAVKGGEADNIGLLQTCLCSLDPDDPTCII